MNRWPCSECGARAINTAASGPSSVRVGENKPDGFSLLNRHVHIVANLDSITPEYVGDRLEDEQK